MRKVSRDALQALQEDTTLAASDSLQNQPKTGKAGANPSQQDVADQSQPQPTFWQRLFRHKETKKAKPGKPGP